MNPNLVRLEIACGLAWFSSDTFWLFQDPLPCYLAGILAVITAVAIFFYQERRIVPILMCCADTSWLFFNIVWSFGDLANWDWAIGMAKCLSVLGGIFFALAFALSDTRRNVFDLVLRRLRILRGLR